MPRQATRLVVGRSAEARLTSRLRLFSTGSRLCAEDDANRRPPPNRRERSVTAASALGAMSRPSNPSSQTPRSPVAFRSLNINGPGFVQPPAKLGAGRPNNIISLKSLPKRADGTPRLARPPAHLASNGVGFRPKFGENGPGSESRLVNRPGGNNFGGPRPPAGFMGVRRPPGAGAGRFGGRFPGRAGTGGFKGVKRRHENREKRKPRDQGESAPISFNEATKAYIRETEMGVDIPYKPSITPDSLVGWGPAVATNTASGLHEIAVRNMRLLAGGRPHSEGEQTFEHTDIARWMIAGKPMYFSSIQQKEGLVKTLQGSKKTPVPIFDIKTFKDTFVKLQKEHGKDYGAFVKAFKSTFDPVSIRAKEEAKQQAKVQHALTTKSGTVKEAIAKYALKGEHPPVQYAHDTYGRLAMYHAHGSTYRPADAAKFDAKMKTLVAS